MAAMLTLRQGWWAVFTLQFEPTLFPIDSGSGILPLCLPPIRTIHGQTFCLAFFVLFAFSCGHNCLRYLKGEEDWPQKNAKDARNSPGVGAIHFSLRLCASARDTSHREFAQRAKDLDGLWHG